MFVLLLKNKQIQVNPSSVGYKEIKSRCQIWTNLCSISFSNLMPSLILQFFIDLCYIFTATTFALAALNSLKTLLSKTVFLFNVSEESRQWMVKHSPFIAPCQSEWGDSKHFSRWAPASAKHENLALSKPTPGSQLSLHTVEVISCDKNWLQEATQEFMTFPGAVQVHSYLGLPVLHSESLNCDNAWLTCWTSRLAGT